MQKPSLLVTIRYMLLSLLLVVNILKSVYGQVIPDGAIAPLTKTPVALPAAYPSAKVNYIRSWEPSMPTTDPAVVSSGSRTTEEVKQTTQYFDGLGRPLQTVIKAITPQGRDLVAPVIYDEFGRETYKYVPYPETTGNTNDGKFKLDPFHNQQTAIEYLNLYPGEQIYYGKTDYEPSPLNRVLKTMAPGNSWAGSGKGISSEYEVNTIADSVKIWTIAAPSGSFPVTSANYAAGELYKNVTADENGQQAIEYKDKEGRIVLKKVQLAVSPGTAHIGWLCTYYVYDDLNNLRFVIPPKSVQAIWNNWTITQTIANELCFRYEYDSRKRMIIKKVPGAGEQELVYDLRDRPIFSRDANLRSEGKWLATFYDGLNRPVMTAFYEGDNRSTLQGMMDTVSGGLSVNYPADLTISSRSGNTPAIYVATHSITFTEGFTSGPGDTFKAYIAIDPGTLPGGGLADNPVPPVSESDLEPLTYTYYDDYSWDGAQNFNSSYLSKLVAGTNPYAETNTAYSTKTRGLITGTKVKVLGSVPEKWLTTTTYYDDKGRVLQTAGSNISGGTDVVTNMYDFSGKLLSSYRVNHNNESDLTPETKVLTINEYDAAGRLTDITKTINDNTATTRRIVHNDYDELGRLIKKTLGNDLETLTYDYNIRGWLRNINKNYAEKDNEDHYFGMELAYDYGFSQPQLNGNIAGEKWRSKGDGEQRAYGFSYDLANRLTKADFTQNNGGWNNSAGIDFSVSNLTYDANGNIISMNQNGLKVNNSDSIDQLSYNYQESSNKLTRVTDGKNDPNTILGDFHDGDNGAADDYSYDGNGNLKTDANKKINNIDYNYLNLPEDITITGKGEIQYIYDAIGNKLRKIVTDQTASLNLTTTIDYINGFIYKNDTLQYFPTEEGRVRTKVDDGQPVSYVYDYFLKDHLGDVRVVLTEQTQQDLYAATMEDANATKENLLFDNVSSTATNKPTGFDGDGNNKKVSRLNGNTLTTENHPTGPSIVLKVMAGDTVMMNAYAWYQNPVQPPPTNPPSLLNNLLDALTGGIIGSSNGKYSGSQSTALNDALSPGIIQFLTDDHTNNYNTTRPKAYLNWTTFDEQFKLVDVNSGAIQVPAAATGSQKQNLTAPTQIIQKNGYIYIYLSNESDQDVFFDDLVVYHNRGPLLEETHYYPFGLTMAGISTTAPLRLESRYKFNGIELQPELGLDIYTARFRTLDPQLGRWWSIDPKPNPAISPYAAMDLNPILHADPLGDTIIPYTMYNSTYTYTKAYDKLSFSNSAMKTMNLFREGGKYSSVKLNFTFFKDENGNYKSRPGNATTYSIITKDGKVIPMSRNLKLAREILGNPLSGKGSLQVDIKSNYFSTVKNPYADAQYVYLGEDLLHEVQHAVIGLNGLSENSQIPSEHEQHTNYLRRSPYSNERFNFYKEYQGVWMKDYQNRINQGWNKGLTGNLLYTTPNEFIQYRINDFIDY